VEAAERVGWTAVMGGAMEAEGGMERAEVVLMAEELRKQRCSHKRRQTPLCRLWRAMA
jgi:hypothetical protein